MQQPEVKVILSGGGTGGHIYPALAIAEAIKNVFKDCEILFVGATGRMEMEKVPAAGYRIEDLPIMGFQRRITFENLRLPFSIAVSLIKARKIIRGFKPDAVIGTGGYASGPTLRMAALMGIPTYIQEQNSFPGITNRALARNARKVFVAYDGMDKYFEKSKINLVGNPIRQEIAHLSGSKGEALAYFGLDPQKPVLLVIGGSLGSRTINQSIQNSLEGFVKEGIQLIWQTGKLFTEEAKESLKGFKNVGMYTSPFISRMDLAYVAADIIVSRAGAIAISELCSVGKPAILIPSPNVAEDHQTKNARALALQEAALLLPDNEAPAKLKETILALAKDKNRQQSLAKNISKMAFQEAAKEIAFSVLKDIGKL